MGFLGKLLGMGIGTTVESIGNVVDKFVETPEEKKAAEIVMMKLMQEPDRLQVELNKIEAGHRSVFIAGWRPMVGWLCCGALGWGWIVLPILKVFMPEQPMPQIATNESISLIMALLGMGALRTYDKSKGLSK